jgi:hypothetical protein
MIRIVVESIISIMYPDVASNLREVFETTLNVS